ncbi:MAG: hypothetical protein ABEK59_05255 [Halobacteria archaeon]
MSENKHIQTELDEKEYSKVRKTANELGLSLKEACRHALVEWVERKEGIDKDDPAFTVIDKLEEINEEYKTDVRKMDDTAEVWSGEDVDISLSENPPN